MSILSCTVVLSNALTMRPSWTNRACKCRTINTVRTKLRMAVRDLMPSFVAFVRSRKIVLTNALTVHRIRGQKALTVPI
jgi:hypothetical protein